MHTSIKNARRAARKQGLEQGEYNIVQGEQGFVIQSIMSAPVTEGAAAALEQGPTDTNNGDDNGDETEIVGTGETIQPIEPVEAALEKALVEPTDASTDKPVAFVWAFLSANRGATRKRLIKTLIEHYGLNPNMTKTQTSRWFKVDGDKDAYLAIEKGKRDAEKAKIDAMAAKIAADKKAEAEAIAVAAEVQASEVKSEGDAPAAA